MLYVFIHLSNRYLLCPFYVADRVLGTTGNTGRTDYAPPALRDFTVGGKRKIDTQNKHISQLGYSDENKMLGGVHPTPYPPM